MSPCINYKDQEPLFCALRPILRRLQSVCPASPALSSGPINTATHHHFLKSPCDMKPSGMRIRINAAIQQPFIKIDMQHQVLLEATGT